MKLTHTLLAATLLCTTATPAFAQPVMATGGQKMPAVWIDKDTRHKVVRLSNKEGKNASFYFHNQPFVGNKMVFYSTDAQGKQLYTVDLQSQQIEQLTWHASSMNGEIVGTKTGQAYYQIKDSVFATNTRTKETKLLYVFPADFKAGITTLNADETLLAGRYSDGVTEREILKQYPEKSQFFERIFNAKIPNTLFVIDLKTGTLKKIHQENTWLGHVQFSPTQPSLLMFCQEGPWHKVDRIWTIDVNTKAIQKMHTRTMDMEIAGHEFFSPDGNTIWYDLQTPRSVAFYLAGKNVQTGAFTKYALTRDEWSIHYNISPDQKLFAGDGGDEGQVAKAKDGRWIYLFRPEGDRFKSERLVNMQHHGYKLEPNVHFSPDGKWIIFRANFEGEEQVYAVEIKQS